ncbi:MAG TPA: alpha/beta fold hydrolase [Steroidobacteraceae bacterium]|nr:alpha/beta fold hydrolase [Steroidobacteraceae bacterium]
MSPLYTEIRGSGPTLVLLHGWGLNLRVWDRLADALCGRFRIVAVDLPGHGRSGWLPESSSLEEQAAQVAETISAISRQYSLLGWSLGAQIALCLAAREHPPIVGAGPATLERLVLIAATARFSAAPDWPHGTPPERLREQAAAMRSDYRRMVGDFLELQVRGSASGAATLDELRSALFGHATQSPGPCLAALARDLELLRDSDLRPLLERVSLPTLVIAGQYDRVIQPAASQALAHALPAARYVEIRRAAHAPFLSHLPELSTLLSDFLLPPQ